MQMNILMSDKASTVYTVFVQSDCSC